MFSADGSSHCCVQLHKHSGILVIFCPVFKPKVDFWGGHLVISVWVFFPMNRFHLHPLVSSVFEKKKIMPSGTLEQFRGPYNHMNESFPFHLHAIYHILALFRVISSPHT